MNKRDYNVVGNEGTDNQELAKGIAFIKSRRAESQCSPDGREYA